MPAEDGSSYVIDLSAIDETDLPGSLAALQESLDSAVESISRVLPNVIERITDSLAPLVETAERLSPHMRLSVLRMANAGWYLEDAMGISTILAVGRALDDDDSGDADLTLANYFEDRVDAIERYVLKRFPERQAPVCAAMVAHRKGDFYLSVPVFLAQADGICQQTTGVMLYSKDDGVPKTAEYVQMVATNVFAAALLSPLAEAQPIAANAKERGPEWRSLNRHQVLHGESFDYGTRVNSLKALSLLKFVAQLEAAAAPGNS